MTRTPGGELLTAGRFGASTLLSAKALRIYADRGLLPPSWIDPANGYRYYRPEQIPVGWLIGLLRSAGVSLDDIEQIVDAEPGDAVAALDRVAAIQLRRTQTNVGVLARARLHLLEESAITPTGARPTTVQSELLPDQAVLSVLRRMSPAEMDTVVIAEVARLRATALAAGLTITGDPFGIFHSPVTDDSDGPLEITLPVDALADLDGDIRSYRLTGGLVANRHAVGEETFFPEILALYDEVHSWITGSGRTPVGPPREIWHNSPRDDEPLRLTVCWPYAG